jgi:hypothetical protein
MISVNPLSDTSLSDSIVILLYIVYVISLSKKLSNTYNVSVVKLFVLISVEHIALTIFYYITTLTGGGDSTAYFNHAMEAESWLDTIGSASKAVEFMVYPLIHYLNLSYLGCFFIFSGIGLTAYFMLLKIGLNLTSNGDRKWLWILLLPNLHFWTVAIGKDVLMFYAICLLLHTRYFNKHWAWQVLAAFLVGVIRIHILASIIMAYVTGLVLLRKKVKLVVKIFVVAVVVGTALFALPIIAERVGFGSRGEESISEYIERTQGYNQFGDSSVYLGDSNILVKMFSYFFRPLFFDAHNSLALISSIENVAWVVIFFYLLKRWKPQNNKIQIPPIYWFAFIAIFTVSIPLAMVLNNLGIAVRQKTMVFPFIFTCLVLQHSNKMANRLILNKQID